MADAATGSSGVIRIDVSESNLNPGSNNSQINWAFYLIEASTNNSTWTGQSIAASVDWVGNSVLWQGGFSFDWRGAGNQTTLIASGAFNPGRNPDGSGTITLRGNIADTGTVGAGGPASVSQQYILAKLTQAPGTPTNVAATRLSDTQVRVTWSQTSPSNGQPTSNSIQRRINGGAWSLYTSIGPSGSATLAAAYNQKIEYRVQAANAVAASPYSAASAPVYTTPATPTNPKALKGSDLGITVTFQSNVDYAEHNHEVWHGTVAGGLQTWDATPLVTLAAGVFSYKHAAPNPSKVHVYRVRAKAGNLYSPYAVTSSVQLLVAPNKPTVPAMATSAKASADLMFSWVHNSVDTTPQTSFEFSYSINGGISWGSYGRTFSPTQSLTIPAGTYPPGTALTSRVRTWGAATSGGADGEGASPWSNLRTVTYKTGPVATITSPANGSTINDSVVKVDLGFTQPEGATFVKAQLDISRGIFLTETIESAVQYGIAFATPAQNDTQYTIRARIQDSNGLWSAWVSSTFEVEYLAPVAAVVATTYLEEYGFGQIDLVIPLAGPSHAEAQTVSIVRIINDIEDSVAEGYPISRGTQLKVTPDWYVIEETNLGTPESEVIIGDSGAEPDMTFIDTTPTIHGTNTYAVTTTSALGAQTTVYVDMVTEECRRAFLSKGAGFNVVGVFGGNAKVSQTLSVASDTIQAAGRTKPIGLFGTETSVQLKVTSSVFGGFGSTLNELRELLLVPGRACYRDPTGRRIFGVAKGSVSYTKTTRGELSFTLTETS